jgi:hypothetical protein
VIAEFLRAEDVMQRHGKKAFRRSFEWWRAGVPFGLACGFDQEHTGITAAERTTDFLLELVERLDRIPSCRPVAGE